MKPVPKKARWNEIKFTFEEFLDSHEVQPNLEIGSITINGNNMGFKIRFI